MSSSKAKDLRHMPLIEALWSIVERYSNTDVYQVLRHRYKVEYDEVKRELRSKDKCSP